MSRGQQKARRCLRTRVGGKGNDASLKRYLLDFVECAPLLRTVIQQSE